MMPRAAEELVLSRFVSFSREEWANLRSTTPLPLTESELVALRGLNEPVSLDEVARIYLPLSRLLSLYVEATRNLYTASAIFLGSPADKVPYVIGIAGSVAVGKSTTARILRTLLARWPHHPAVELVTTDGFLYPNRVLEERGLMGRKGFPESYDVRRLLRFLADVKAGRFPVTAPVYSHLTYDIVPDAVHTVQQPDIVIVEGLNVLQTGSDGAGGRAPRLFVSDFFDFSIYVDASEDHIARWFEERFLTLRETAFRDERSFFHRFAQLSVDEALSLARTVWHTINAVNLRDNILPTRERAHLILHKGLDHAVQEVRLRKI